MPTIMKRLVPVLFLLLPSCNVLPALLGGGNPSGDGTAATAPATQGSSQVSSSAGAAAAPATASTDPSPGSSVKSVSIDTTKKMEYVNLWVDLGDPAGQRALVPYLMKPEEWMLIKCEMLSPTSKHYTFQRVTTADGRALPQVDLFKQGR